MTGLENVVLGLYFVGTRPGTVQIVLDGVTRVCNHSTSCSTKAVMIEHWLRTAGIFLFRSGDGTKTVPRIRSAGFLRDKSLIKFNRQSACWGVG